MKISAALIALAALWLPAAADDPVPFRHGEIRLRMVSGQETTEFRYRLMEGRMRIDRPGEVIPAPPVNLLDLASGTLCILRPHNGTWQEVSAEKLRSPPPGRPTPPPGIGPRQDPAITPPGQIPAGPAGQPATGADFPGIPPMPEIPWPPGRSPGDIWKEPGAPALPPVIPGQASPLELKVTGEKRELHGYPCVRHTVALPREGEVVLWLAGPGLFPPFHLLEAEAPRPEPRRDGFSRIPMLLRGRDLFPLQAEWKGEDGSLVARWEVIGIAAGPVEDDSLFEVPAAFHRLDIP
jgi:hypothetical protein